MHAMTVVALTLTLADVVVPMRQASMRGEVPARTATAQRATGSVVIDGRHGDAVWRAAPTFSAFRQFAPDIGADPSFRTEFQVAYDDRYLYVYVRAYDAHPDSIMHALTRRDVRGPSDQIKVIIDSYDDSRTGFEFSVNPDRVKRDFAVFNDEEEDGSWNGVWSVGTQVDSLGWTAEFRIPLSQLRYAAASSHTFGFGIWRDIERYGERVAWPEFDPTRSGLISQLGRLDGIAGITSAHPLELTPYLVTRNVTRPAANGEFDRVQNVSVGGNLKLGITPNITLDATVNPDFGQVEADPAVVNLTAFETFLAERRPFFVEGTGLYRFRLNCYIVVDCNTNEGLFYSRRIGRAPSLLDDYGDPATPVATPIAGAAKLTGRTASGLAFGVLDAVTLRVAGAGDQTVEPRTNYAVVRAQQDLRGGEAGVSLIATAVNRSLDEWTRPMLHRSSYVTGMTFRNRFGGGNYELAGSAAASRVSGSAEAILRTQRGAVHYFQQPDDDVDVDSTRTSLSGHAEQIKFGKYGGGITRFETSLVRQSAGFEVNDLGFLRRADVLDWSTWAALRFQDQRWFYRWAQVNANHWQQWNTSGLRLEHAWNVNAHVGFENNWNAHAGATIDGLGRSFCDRCTRGGPPLRRSPGFSPWFGVNGDNRRALVPSLWLNLSYADEGKSRRSSINPEVSLRLSTGFQASLGVDLTNDHDHTQWYDHIVDDAGVTHHTFAHLDQRTVSMSVRVNYTMTPELTLEFYGEPFVSTGTYSEFRELSATPDADSYAARFQPFTLPPDSDTAFKVTRLRTNAVLRWEYRPGSTLFLVWAHGREADTNERSQHSWRRDYRDLFGLHPDNTFLIKVSYWLSRT